MRRYLTLLLLVALAIAGCGGGQHAQLSRPAARAALQQACPPNESHMGCSLGAQATPQFAPSTAAPRGALFPDVYEGQGAVNWSSVKAWQRAHGWHTAAIFKMGEFRLDHQLARNAQQTGALGFWRAGYWFVRNIGCGHESSLITSTARRYGLKVVVLDDEVPEARGYAACLAPAVRAAGLTVVEYSSPGSNPDGVNPGLNLWVAAFGPSHVPCLFTCSVGVAGRQSILAWQFTDGQFGPVVNVPGVGRDDVNVDFGIEKLGAPVKPPPPPVPWSSAEVQIQGARPNATVTLRLARGHWTIAGAHARVHSLPFNTAPLGP